MVKLAFTEFYEQINFLCPWPCLCRRASLQPSVWLWQSSAGFVWFPWAELIFLRSIVAEGLHWNEVCETASTTRLLSETQKRVQTQVKSRHTLSWFQILLRFDVLQLSRSVWNESHYLNVSHAVLSSTSTLMVWMTLQANI